MGDLGFDRGRSTLSPLDELELMDLKVRAAAIDEDQTHFDPDTHPKPPARREEAVTDEFGEREVDLMLDTPPIDDEVAFDLTQEELQNVDLF